MRIFKRLFDTTDYGGPKRRQEFYDREGVKPGESAERYVKRKGKEFEKRERKLARRAKRRNRGSLF